MYFSLLLLPFALSMFDAFWRFLEPSCLLSLAKRLPNPTFVRLYLGFDWNHHPLSYSIHLVIGAGVGALVNKCINRYYEYPLIEYKLFKTKPKKPKARKVHRRTIVIRVSLLMRIIPNRTYCANKKRKKDRDEGNEVQGNQ